MASYSFPPSTWLGKNQRCARYGFFFPLYFLVFWVLSQMITDGRWWMEKEKRAKSERSRDLSYSSLHFRDRKKSRRMETEEMAECNKKSTSWERFLQSLEKKNKQLLFLLFGRRSHRFVYLYSDFFSLFSSFPERCHASRPSSFLSLLSRSAATGGFGWLMYKLHWWVLPLLCPVESQKKSNKNILYVQYINKKGKKGLALYVRKWFQCTHCGDYRLYFQNFC